MKPEAHPNFPGVHFGTRSWFECTCGYSYTNEDQSAVICPKCSRPRDQWTQVCIWGSDQNPQSEDPILQYDMGGIHCIPVPNGLRFSATPGVADHAQGVETEVELRWRGRTMNEIYNSRSLWKAGRCVESYTTQNVTFRVGGG